MKKFVGFLLFFFVITLGSGYAANKKILVYTKNGKGYIHDNIAANVEALKKLGAANNLTVVVSADSAVFTEENLKQYDCLVFSNTNNETFDTDAQRLAFVRYIQSGGGFVGIHSVCGSERTWPCFWSMLGGKFKRHAPYGPFDIKIIDNTNLSTASLPNIWKWEDECYYLDNLNPDIHVLLAADMRTVTDKQKAEYPSNIFGDYFPLSWYHEFEGGRVFFTALGHNIKHYSDPIFLNHILGGINWAIGKNPKRDYSKAKTTELSTVPVK
jgi:type 1 glutamine amidotransferase